MRNRHTKVLRAAGIAAVMFVLACGGGRGGGGGGGGGSTSVTVGPLEKLMESQETKRTIRFWDYPDGHIGAFWRDGRYNLFLAGLAGLPVAEGIHPTATARFTGTSLNDLRPDPADASGHVVPVAKEGCPTCPDNGGNGISSVYFDEASGRLYAWSQLQDYNFPEEVKEAAMKYDPTSVLPQFQTIASGVSGDLGRTFAEWKLAVTSNWPRQKIFDNAKRIEPPNQEEPFWEEIGFPSVVRIGDYLYMYYGSDKDAATGRYGIALARLHVSDLDKVPQPWKKLYNGMFEEPGLGGRFTPLLRGFNPSVSWNKHLGRFIMLYHPFEGLNLNLELRTSPDGIQWSGPVLLLESSNPGVWYAGPTIVAKEPGANLWETGKEFWVYFMHTTDSRKENVWLARILVTLSP